MVRGFHSMHWQGRQPVEKAARRAHAELMRPTTPEAYLAAFRTMLASTDPVAVGIALDHFQYSAASSRFGGADELEKTAAEVLAAARAQLRQPPSPAGVGPFPGANHASALYAMMNLAEPADAALIRAALVGATEVNVRSTACRAAARALRDADEPDVDLVTALGTVAADADQPLDFRTEALGALRDVDGPEATAVLLRALDSPEFDLQVQAAWGLTLETRLPTHRQRLEQVVAAWPVDARYPADEVHEALAETAES